MPNIRRHFTSIALRACMNLPPLLQRNSTALAARLQAADSNAGIGLQVESGN